MANNNTEATTHLVLTNPTSGGAYSYDDSTFTVGLLSTATHQDQIEIVREFVWDSADGVAPTAEELKTVYTLPYAGTSGSTMYTLDEANKTITFSSAAGAYTWVDGLHHSRGAGNIILPVWTTNDTVTIRRKTPVKHTDQTWATGSKVTAARLNAQFGQMLNIAQEIRSFLLNPTVFDTYIGTKNGICPLDNNAKVALNYIPSSLGGTGTDNAIDVSGTNISEFANVSTDAASPTKTHLIWDNDTSKWTPKEPLSSLVTNLSSGSFGDVLQWTGTAWSLVTLTLNSMHNVDLTSTNNVTGDLLYWDEAASKWKNTAWGTVPTSNQVLMWVDGKWTPQTYSGTTVTSDELANHSISECGDVSYYSQTQGNPVNPTVDGDIMSFFSYGSGAAANIKMKPKSVDIYDINDVKYVGQLPTIKDGNLLVWDSSQTQNDQDDDHPNPMGAWVWGQLSYLSDDIDFSSIANHDVLQMNAAGEWNLAQLNIYHLGDVNAGYDTVADGQTLVFDKPNNEWVPGNVPVGANGARSGGGEAQYLTVTKTYQRPQSGYDAGNDGQDWFETFVWGGQNYVGKKLIPVWYHIFGLNPSMDAGSANKPTYEWMIKKTTFGELSGGTTTWDDMAWWKGGAPPVSGTGSLRFYTSPSTSKLAARRKVTYDDGGDDRSGWVNDGVLVENDVLVFRPRYSRAPEYNNTYYPMSIQICFEVVDN